MLIVVRMIPIKRLLMPTDLNDGTSMAMSYAMAIALAGKAEMWLLHFDPVASRTMHVAGLRPAVEEHEVVHARHRQEMDRLVDEMERQGISVHPLLADEYDQEDIVRFTDSLKVDLVVMGTPHQASFPGPGGSHAGLLMRNSETPLLIVPDIPEITLKPQALLFASTFRNEQQKAIASVAALASVFKARVDVVFLNLFSHLIMEDVAREKVLQSVRAYPEIRFTVNVLNTNDEQWGVNTLAARLDSDLIAVSMEHRSLLGRLLDPPFAERMLSHLRLPLLVVHSD